MSEAEKRRDWRAWEGWRDEAALRRYVWALCREAPPTPGLEGRALESDDGTSYVIYPHAVAGVVCERTVTAPVRRLTVCGPWPPKLRGWNILRGVQFPAIGVVVSGSTVAAGSLLYMGADGTLRANP